MSDQKKKFRKAVRLKWLRLEAHCGSLLYLQKKIKNIFLIPIEPLRREGI